MSIPRGNHSPSSVLSFMLCRAERPSPRSTPAEALEEFLSILQHTNSFRFQPTSPVLRPTTNNASFFAYRRQTPCTLSPSLPSEGLGLTLAGDRADDKENEGVVYPFKLLGSSLGTSTRLYSYPTLSPTCSVGSPVSRMPTRNPFQRHPSYETHVAGLLGPPPPSSPSPTLGLSPAAIPLPLPTPDEIEIEKAY